MVRLTTLAALLALALTGGALAQDVGTAAAVNPATQGTPPGSGIRTLSLGDNIIHNEKVTTNAAGLLQILFVDGTTLTLGPNSEIVVDTFFYDPNAGTAKVAVTMTKGVLRFIGGLASKTEGGATIDTPVGTIGIRGGITDVNLNPPNGTPPHIDLLFGTEVTLQQGIELVGRLFKGGYSLVLGADGSVTIQKTPPEWSSQIQQALAGKAGTNGGSSSQPTDDTVENSEIAENNSDGNPPNDAPPLTDSEIEQLLVAAATYDELHDFIVDDGDTPPKPPVTPPVNEPPAGSDVFVGASAGIIHIQNYDTAGNPLPLRYIGARTTGYSRPDGELTTIAYDGEGNVIYGYFDLLTGAGCTDCRGQVRIDETGSVGTYSDQTGIYQAFGTGNVRDHSEQAYSIVNECTSCNDFMKWGFFDASGRIETTGGVADTSLTNGTWVAGDLTTPTQLDALATLDMTPGSEAHFYGHAIGSVFDVDNGGEHMASGDMFMSWSFADRTGDIQINQFDPNPENYNYGYDFHGSLAADGTQFFAGNISDSGATINGSVHGAFVNDGTWTARGVAGDFAVTRGGDYIANGIFLGDTYSP